ncbi:MAG: thioredoxin-like domain-containing protein [Chloroflexota bacterium]|nr:thioredoxin-like domain-containing protein [Chloroflexota bacterium]MDE2884196.1 thioredoxin-like domain-containing protein [Chloroflexota bacterium]
MTTDYGRVNAPEFPEGADWLNADRPLRLADFAGKLLLLDFWTYCCINCMHLLPTLRRLEREFPEELAVVGVHTAKYDQERATENVRQAVMRYGIRHPVLNDASMEMWRQYAVRAWPTLMFVDPTGRVVGKVEGELGFEQGAALIRKMLEIFRAEGTLHPGPHVYDVESPLSGVLRYPGKVLADAAGERLFIADSGHHRVLVTDTDGQIQTVVGSGQEGFADGVPEGARFSSPQGMALSGEVLYVADTGNHAIRAVDLEMAVVDTVVGTGERGEGRVDGGPGPTVPLRSPWDLVLVGTRLFIAMAGSHQLWMYDLESGLVQAVAGAGGEGIVDGLPEDALLAQPSGIAADEDGVLFFVDSETSAVRRADLISAYEVTTLVGAGLFDFGDVDGDALRARMQHPLGVSVEGGIVYVADTYNNKIKRVGTETLTVGTMAGTGAPGHEDGAFASARFYEPGGLSILEERIFVADTNNHAVRVVDVADGTVSTLPVDY